MAADPRLANLPALRKLAEEEARARMELFHRQNPPPNPGARLPVWADFSRSYREELTAVEIEILSDLTRPASRDAVCRLVAERAKIRLWAVHLLLLGGTEYPPEWPPSLTDALASATDTEALTLIALHVLGRSDADR